MENEKESKTNNFEIECINEKQVDNSIKQIEKERNSKKNLPEIEEQKIHKKVFENLLIANIIIAFLYIVGLGSLNIETPIFLVDLKVFSIGLIIFTIILFEISYKKENGNLCIHGIECFVLAAFMLFSNYLYSMYIKDFQSYVAVFAYMVGVYYVGKSIVVQQKMKKQYAASLSDIDEIIKK
ncbi:MAG: MFS transporter [Clostridia bacterium]|nr:MFS transporter [Clostridia bacterium]